MPSDMNDSAVAPPDLGPNSETVAVSAPAASPAQTLPKEPADSVDSVNFSGQASSGQVSSGRASSGQASPGQASPGQASPDFKKGVEGDFEEHVVDHLKELRKRIIIAGAALLIGTLIFYPFSGDAIAYLWDKLIPESVIMSVYSPTEYLMTRLKLSVAFAICVFFPLLMYELFKFMSRGLYKNERKFLIKSVPLSFILFILGASVAYFIVLPLFLTYILFYSDQTAVAQIGLAETFNTIISLVLGFGFVFQIPLLMVSVVRMGIVEEKTLRKSRIVVYGALIGFTFLIAPDPTLISQLLAGVVLVILFEFSLLLLKII